VIPITFIWGLQDPDTYLIDGILHALILHYSIVGWSFIKSTSAFFIRCLTVLLTLTTYCQAQLGAPRLLWSQPSPPSSVNGFDFAWAADGGYLAAASLRGGAEIDYLAPLESSSSPIMFSAPQIEKETFLKSVQVPMVVYLRRFTLFNLSQVLILTLRTSEF